MFDGIDTSLYNDYGVYNRESVLNSKSEYFALVNARKLIAKKRCWVKGHMRKTVLSFFHSYCSYGAIRAACKDAMVISECVKILDKAANIHLYPNIIALNDSRHTSHKDVLTAWDTAIELARDNYAASSQ